MKIRTNLHAGEQLCGQANLWRKQAKAAAEDLKRCKKLNKLPDFPIYIDQPYLPIGGGEVVGYLDGVTGSVYNGMDYSGYCG